MSLEENLCTSPKDEKKYNWFCFKHLTAKQVNTLNVIHLGIGFMLLFMAFNPAQNYSVRLLGDTGAACFGIVNFSFSLLNILAPSIILKFGQARYALSISSFEYGLFILQFSYLIVPLALSISAVHGFTAGIVWAAQGVYINDCSTDEDRGSKAGLFWAIYMLSNVFGNLVAVGLSQIFPVSDEPGHDGWNGNVSILFLVLGFFGICGSFVLTLLRKPIKVADMVPVSEIDSEIQKVLASEEIPKKPETVKDKIIAYGRMIINPKVLLLVLLMFGSGYMMMWPSAMFNRQFKDATVLGLAMTIYGIAEVVFSLIFGKISDLLGNTVVITSGTVIGLLGLVAGIYANEQQNWLIHVAAALYAISDCAFQTQLMALSGQMFNDAIDTAFAVLRMFQIFGASLCFFLAPVFVESGMSSVGAETYFIETCVCAGLIVIGYISYIILACVYGTNWVKGQTVAEVTEGRLSRTSSIHEAFFH